jgi:hypothetical protein
VSEPPEPPAHRLDPDRVVEEKSQQAPPPPPAIDTRPYRWMIGIFGLVLVVAISIYQFASRGVGTTGVPAGQKLHYFVAPLATSTLNLDANARPRCDPSHPNPQALNVCGQTPLVLAFFAIGSGSCERQVDTMQAISRTYAPQGVQFAAIAVRASARQTASLVRSHRWTIPVAYDRDGAVGDLYGLAVCPLVEVSYRGGVVASRLIGQHWLTGPALKAQVQAMLNHQP